MRALFICNVNRNRSKTAEEVFSDRFETRSAGLYENIVSQRHLNWADLIIVMTKEQEKELRARFPSLRKTIVNLNIPDIYFYRQPELINELEKRAELLQQYLEE